ncbi:MAG: GNAT family N-acetyltransferase [Alphaproteobacteria bacterium]|nr:GNAT family N-acetyltransferase [Alphaproteobacteria bacterium]
MPLRQRLETDRLLLRQFVEGDVTAFAEIAGDPEVMRHITGQVFDETASWRWVASLLGHWQLRGFGYWAVVKKRSGNLIGRVGSGCSSRLAGPAWNWGGCWGARIGAKGTPTKPLQRRSIPRSRIYRSMR